MVLGSNPCEGEICHNHPDWPWDPPVLFAVGTGSFPGIKWTGHGISHPPPSSAKVNERVELYLYSPCVLLWQVIC